MSGNHTPPTNLERAIAAWPVPAPDWVQLLARSCDATNQRVVADRLGKSSGYVSRVINNRYPGDLAEAERQVRAALGAERVMCPAFGDMALATCIANRRRARPANWMHVQLARTCPDCPNNTDRQED